MSRSRLIADVQGCGQHWGRLAEVLCSICNQGMYLDGNAVIFSGAILGAANPSHAYSLFVDATLANQPGKCMDGTLAEFDFQIQQFRISLNFNDKSSNIC